MEKQKTMADLLPGEKGTVRGLKAKSGMRRRLQDLGLIVLIVVYANCDMYSPVYMGS